MTDNKFQYNSNLKGLQGSSSDVPSQSMDMSLLKSLDLLRRFWWLIFGLIALSMIGSYFYVQSLTPLYKSRALVEVRQSEINSTGSDGVEDILANNEYLNTQLALIKSRSLLKDIVLNQNLNSDPRLVSQNLSEEDQVIKAVGEIKRNLSISILRRTRIIQIAYSTTDPSLAADVPNAVAQGFVDYSLNRGSKTNSYAEDVLRNNIDGARAELEASEKKLASYARRQGLLGVTGSDSANGGEGGAVLQSNDLIQLNGELRDAVTNRIQLEENLNAITDGLDAPAIKQRAEIRTLNKEISNLEDDYQAKLDVYQPAYPLMVDIKERIEKLKAQALSEYESILSVTMFELEAARKLENSLSSRVNSLTKEINKVRTSSIQYNILKREVETNRSQYDSLLNRLNEVAVLDNQGSNLVSLVDKAIVPRAPYSPREHLIYLLAAVAGIAAGTTILFIMSLMDNKIRDPEDIISGLNMPVLGVIPHFSSRNSVTEMLSDPLSSVSETYATTRANIELNVPDFNQLKTLHITSTRPAEGKSSTAYALAAGFAKSGRRTLLVDADMRRPTFDSQKGKLMGLSGLLEYPREALKEEDVMNSVEAATTENLFLLPSGKIPTNPSQLLSQNRFKPLLDLLGNYFDLIIVDSPPVLGLSDALYCASSCDATIFVCEANALQKSTVKNLLRRLAPSANNLIGVVMTKYKTSHGKYYYYSNYNYGYNAYSYGSSKSKSTKGTSRKKRISMFSD